MLKRSLQLSLLTRYRSRFVLPKLANRIDQKCVSRGLPQGRHNLRQGLTVTLFALKVYLHMGSASVHAYPLREKINPSAHGLAPGIRSSQHHAAWQYDVVDWIRPWYTPALEIVFMEFIASLSISPSLPRSTGEEYIRRNDRKSDSRRILPSPGNRRDMLDCNSVVPNVNRPERCYSHPSSPPYWI